MPVYERGRKLIDIMFVSYKGAHPSYDLQIDDPTFNKISNTLKERSETKSGISSYYTLIRYIS